MKKIINIFSFLLIISSATAQTIPAFKFRKPILDNGVWKFKSVLAGVDAHVTITASKNATLDKIDDSASYAYAWQPNIKFTNSTNNVNDSSYLEFTIRFVDKTTFAPLTQSLLATTIIDCDGPGNSTTYREFVRTAMPGNVYAVQNSSISITNDTKWLYFKSGTAQFSNIDTTDYAAMAQVNYTNINTLVMRVGVLGKISSNSVRQFSFYFKGFEKVLIPLPVKLNSFDVQKNNQSSVVKWTSVSEENVKLFEITRSLDGVNFDVIGKVNAIGNSNALQNYEFVDFGLTQCKSENIFYKLKVVENDGQEFWSHIVQIKNALENNIVFNIYPNPAIDKVQLDFKSDLDEIVVITVMDVNGKLVKHLIDPQMNGKSFEIDIRDLKNGLYFIDITDINGVSASRKFLKR